MRKAPSEPFKLMAFTPRLPAPLTPEQQALQGITGRVLALATTNPRMFKEAVRDLDLVLRYVHGI